MLPIYSMIPDEVFMQRSFELARLGAGTVSPNPLVGCVIVSDNTIIGEGYHQKYGEAHAEVNAVADVKDKSLLAKSTVYVNLEPCAHFGKTPPCVDLLIQERVKRVVISNTDSNPLVGGKGIKKLKDAGIAVVTDVLAAQGRALNKRFFTYIEQQRPHIILKWAQTQDGYLARANYDSKWISGELARQWVHKWRAEEDAILVGKNTAAYDNPKLTVRDWPGRNPVRVLLDHDLVLPKNLHLFDKTVPTLCYNQKKSAAEKNIEWIKVASADFISGVLSDLYQRKIQSVLVEGGSWVLREFIRLHLWDEARVFCAPHFFESGIAAPIVTPPPTKEIWVEKDRLRIYFNP